MPNIKSAKKRVLIAERNRLRNIAAKSALKTAIRRVLEAVKANDNTLVAEKLAYAYKLLDKAAGKGIIHKNTAARKKSRLTIFINKNVQA